MPVSKTTTQKAAKTVVAGARDKPTSTLEQLKQLDLEQEKLVSARTKLLNEAKAELLERGRVVVEELGSLGFAYTLTVKTPPPQKKSELDGRSGPRATPQGSCLICEFETKPAHDRRSHRHQEPKAPFSPEELKQKKLVRA